MKNNRDHLLTKGYQRAKFEVQATFTSWDIMFTKFSYFDLLKWPDLMKKNMTYSPSATSKFEVQATFTKWSDLLTKCYLHTKFEVQATFNSWDIMFTRF